MKTQRTSVLLIVCVVVSVGMVNSAFGDAAGPVSSTVTSSVTNVAEKHGSSGTSAIAGAALALSGAALLGGPAIGLTASSRIDVTVEVLRADDKDRDALKLGKPSVLLAQTTGTLTAEQIQQFVAQAKNDVEIARSAAKKIGAERWVNAAKDVEGENDQFSRTPNVRTRASLLRSFESFRETPPPSLGEEGIGKDEETTAAKAAIQRVLAILPDTSQATVTHSLNVGPLVQEGIQTLLAQSKAIDIVMDPQNEKRWVKVNKVHSYYGAGNSNTIIYFENLAVPILKQATYNPNNFIVANKVAFEKAFNTAADLVGLPSSKAGTGADTRNIWVVRANLANAEQMKRENARKLQEALNAAETLKVKGVPNGSTMTLELEKIAAGLGVTPEAAK